MPYDFSIDKKTGVILIAGYALVGVLLFVAGFLLGIEYRFSSRPADLMVQSSPAKSPQASSEAPAAKPTEQSAQVSPPPTAQAQPVPTPVLTPTPLDEQPPASTAPNASLETGPSASASPTNNTPQAAVQPPVIPRRRSLQLPLRKYLLKPLQVPPRLQQLHRLSYRQVNENTPSKSARFLIRAMPLAWRRTFKGKVIRQLYSTPRTRDIACGTQCGLVLSRICKPHRERRGASRKRNSSWPSCGPQIPSDLNASELFLWFTLVRTPRVPRAPQNNS